MNPTTAAESPTIHLFTDAATWTALAAIVILTDQHTPGNRAKAIDVTPFTPSTRALAAGLHAARTTRRPIRSDARVVAWDQPAERWASARGLTGRPAPKDLPIPTHLLTPRDEARRSLGITDDAIAVAVLDSAPARLTPTGAALLAAATGLAGTPMTIVIFSAAPLARADARSLEKIGNGSRIVTTSQPLWRVLSACDIALPNTTSEIDSANDEDVPRWAADAGVAIARQPRVTEDSRHEQRLFALARTLVRALEGDTAVLEHAALPGAGNSLNEADWRETLRVAIQASYSSV